MPIVDKVRGFRMVHFSETVFSKNIALETKEIYSLGLDILDSMSAFGTINEKEHEFDTSGPRKAVKLVFDLVDELDAHSSMIFSFRISGESNGHGLLEVDFNGMLSVKIDQKNMPGSLAFNSFYIENILPLLEKYMEKRISFMGKFIEKKARMLNFKYT